MNSRTPMMKLALAAMMCVPASACDSEDEGALGIEGLGGLDIQFRDDDCNPLLVNCSYRNNFYLGLEEYGLDNLPLVQGSDTNTTITEIFSPTCYDPRGNLLHGSFHVVAPNLTVDNDGNFGATTFEEVGVVGTTCSVYGDAWLLTEWMITTNAENNEGILETIDAKLRIAEMAVAPAESTLYRWESDIEYLEFGVGTPVWKNTCDEDPDLLLDFHAVVYPHLRIDETTGVFSTDSDTVYPGCTAGVTAKTGYTWGYDSEPLSTRQVVANATMAKYCGPSQESFTETGVAIAVWNKTGSGPQQVVPGAVWTVEAAWDSSMVAMCIGTTRLGEFQPSVAEPDFDLCDGFTIPPCTPQILADPAIMFVTYSEI